MAGAQSESSGLRNLMLAATVVGVLLLMVAAWPLSMSPMIFDSGMSFTTWSIFLAIWTMPVLLIAGVIVGWAGFARNARNIVAAGLVLAALPVLAALGILIMA
jgi:hypothetical protein